MANSQRALIKYNEDSNDPNLQWQPVLPRGEIKVDKWVQTINEITGDQVPLQWTGDLSASVLPIWAELEQPITHYAIGEKGRRGNPNVIDIISVRDTQEKITATFEKYAAHNLGTVYVIFASDRNPWDYADLPGRGN